MASNSLRVNFSWALIGNVVYTVCQGGMLIVLAKLTSPEKVGEFALALSITTPIFLFFNMHLRSIQATDARREYAFGHYLALRIVTSILAMMLICGITGAMRLGKETATVILIVGIAKGLEAISDIYYGRIQRSERMDKIANSLIIRGLLSVFVLTGAVYFLGQVLWGVVGMALIGAVVLAGYDSRVMVENDNVSDQEKPSEKESAKRFFEAQWDWGQLWSLALLALPMGGAVLVINLQVNVPRYFIEKCLGTRELGLFAAMAYPMAAGNVVISSLGLSASPRLAVYYNKGDYSNFMSLLQKLIMIGSILGAAGVVFALGIGRPFLEIVYNAEYAENSDVFVLLMLITAIQYSVIFVSTALNVLRRFRVKLIVHAAGLALLFVLCLWGSNKGLTLKDAVMAMLIASLVEAIAFGIVIVAIVKNKELWRHEDTHCRVLTQSIK